MERGGVGVRAVVRSRTGDALPVPEGRRRKLAGGKCAASARRPRKHRKESPCPSGASQKKGRGFRDTAAVLRSPHWFPTPGEATNRQRGARCKGACEVSPMPRWGMARMAAQPGAASAGAALPPANFLRRPSGTGNRALRGGSRRGRFQAGACVRGRVTDARSASLPDCGRAALLRGPDLSPSARVGMVAPSVACGRVGGGERLRTRAARPYRIVVGPRCAWP